MAHTPIDYLPDPPEFLPRVRNAEAREWGRKVHSLWPSLARVVSPEVEREPDRHTLLPLKHAFIVPGERFREVYYWDSYWVIRSVTETISECHLRIPHFLVFFGVHSKLGIHRFCTGSTSLVR